jgi:hypothetical protein
MICLMLMMTSEPGVLVPALAAASLVLYFLPPATVNDPKVS